VTPAISATLPGNIENLLGVAQVPIGPRNLFRRLRSTSCWHFSLESSTGTR
jgi:hypothetical protein